jgi:hypothetical protein
MGITSEVPLARGFFQDIYLFFFAIEIVSICAPKRQKQKDLWSNLYLSANWIAPCCLTAV